MTSPGQAATTGAVDEIEQALMIVARQLRQPKTWAELRRVIDSDDRFDIDRSAYPLLICIERHGPIRPSALAEQVGVKSSTVSRQVAQLERRELVLRDGDTRDGRASVFTLSATGALLLRRLRDARNQMLQELLSEWSPAERAELARSLSHLARTMAPDLWDEVEGFATDPIQHDRPARSTR